MNKPKFALDTKGYLPQDSAIALIPKAETLRKIGSSEMLKFLNNLVSKLNSDRVAKILKSQVSQKRGGYTRLGESMLERMPIPKRGLWD